MNKGFTKTTLDNVCKVIMGQSPSSSSYNENKMGLPFVGGNADIQKNKTAPRFYTKQVTKKASKENLILTVRAPVGDIVKNNLDICIGRGVCALQIKANSEKEYIYQYLLHNKHKWKAFEQGSTFSAVNSKDIAKFPILLPSLEEQKKMAKILSTWDNAIEAVDELIQNKKLVLKRYYQELIRGDLYKKSAKKLKLKVLFDRVREKNSENNDNVLTISAQFGLVSQLDYFNKDVSGKSLLGYYFIKNGDFAYNRSYSNGYPLGAIKRLDAYSEGVVSTLYLCFRPKNDKEINSDFYVHFFEAGGLNKEISKIAQEGARNHGLLNVSVTDFFDVAIPYPDIEEQNDISITLCQINEEIELLKEKKLLLQKQKKGLMQRLLTGKVSVN